MGDEYEGDPHLVLDVHQFELRLFTQFLVQSA